MKTAFTGYYGMSNYGDDLFAVVCAWASQRYWHSSVTKILGPEIEGANTTFEVPTWFPKNWYGRLDNVGKFSRLSFMIKAMLQNDLIVLAGGSTVSSLNSSGMRSVQRFGARLRATRFAGIGLSIGPFSSRGDASKAQEFLREFDYLSVRDKTSYEIAMQMNLPYKPVLARDLAGMIPLAIPEEAAIPEENEGRLLGVCICNYESLVGQERQIENERNKALFEGIHKFATENRPMTVRVFILNKHPVLGDGLISHQLYEHLKESGVSVEYGRSENGIKDIWKGISQCSAVLSVRLHGAISAYLADVPFALVEYHNKCTDFLDDIGQPASFRLPSQVKDEKEVLNALNAVFHEGAKPRLDRTRYIYESTLNFTCAPWADDNRAACVD